MNIKRFQNLSFKLRLRLVFTIVFVVILGLFFILKIIPSGSATYSKTWPTSFFAGRGFLLDFKPGIRIDNDVDDYLQIIADPVYFSLDAPRSFDKAKVTIKYQENLSKDLAIIELGLLKQGNYELKPLQNKIIDKLSQSWTELIDGDKIILQRDNNYSSSNDFWKDFNNDNLNNCSAGVLSCVAFYNYPFDSEFKLPPFSSIHGQRISQNLRGEHRLFVYLKKGSWRFNFKFKDINLDNEADPISVNVVYRGSVIDSASLEDDGLEALNQDFDSINLDNVVSRSLELRGQAEEDGVYIVEIKAGNDIIIEEIESPSDYLAFVNKFWPVYNNSNLNFYINSKNVSFKTFSVSSLGQIYFDGERVDLDKSYESLNVSAISAEASLKEVRLSNSGVLTELNGLIFLDKENFFNPSAKKIDRFFSGDGASSYIVANYSRPSLEDAMKVAIVEFDLQGAMTNSGRYDFVISVPGLTTASGSSLSIKEIKIEMRGKTLWGKIKEMLNK